MSDPFAEYEALRERVEASRSGRAGPPTARRTWRRRLSRWLLRALAVGAVLALPFYLLVGGSVLAYRLFAIPTWPSLLVGMLLTALVLLLYLARVAKRLSGRRQLPGPVWQVVIGVVAAYCLYALVYVSSLNVKAPDIRAEYRSLHPLLRVATSTFIILDSDLVITDMERQAEDYPRMGLPVYERSLHFVQTDGYAHAVDLRTLGRAEWRVLLTGLYFRVTGFRVFRHVGTADHLHVSLPVPARGLPDANRSRVTWRN